MTRQTFAIVGCGVVAEKHLKAARFHQKKLRLAAVVDPNLDAAVRLLKKARLWPAQKHGIRLFSDLELMLEQERPTLTAITTPSGSHHAIAKAALSHGSHVLVEKPLTLDLVQADDLLQQAKKAGLQIAVGHIYRFFPLVQEIEQDLRQGVFGRLLYGDVKVRWGHDQAYYDQAAWRGTWQKDGGALMNQSIHALDLMTWLLGAKVQSVIGRIDRQQHAMEAEDFGMALLSLEEAGHCMIEGTTNTDPARPEASFFIRGSKGEIRGGILAGRPRIEVRDHRGKKRNRAYLIRYLKSLRRQDGLRSLRQLGNPHAALYGDFIRAIEQQRPPLADGASGRQAVEHVLAIYRSAKESRPVSLPLSGFKLEDMHGYFDA